MKRSDLWAIVVEAATYPSPVTGEQSRHTALSAIGKLRTDAGLDPVPMDVVIELLNRDGPAPQTAHDTGVPTANAPSAPSSHAPDDE